MSFHLICFLEDDNDKRQKKDQFDPYLVFTELVVSIERRQNTDVVKKVQSLGRQAQESPLVVKAAAILLVTKSKC